jgi:hypothetical protein
MSYDTRTVGLRRTVSMDGKVGAFGSCDLKPPGPGVKKCRIGL